MGTRPEKKRPKMQGVGGAGEDTVGAWGAQCAETWVRKLDMRRIRHTTHMMWEQRISAREGQPARGWGKNSN